MKLFSHLGEPILCPFQLFADLSIQFKEALSKKQKNDSASSVALLLDKLTAKRMNSFQEICPLESPTDWVNVDDSLGDLASLRAYEWAQVINEVCCALQVKRLNLQIHLGTQTLKEDSLYGLLLMAEMGLGLDVTFITSSEQPDDLQSKALLLSSRTTDCQFKVLRESTPNACQPLKSLSEHREEILKKHGFMFHVGQNNQVSFDHNHFRSLFGYAWHSLKAGAFRLACDMFELALNSEDLPPSVQEEVFLQLQVIRFLSHQHALVVEANFPETFHHISQERVQYLYFIKAFSATMTRQLTLAETYFQKAGITYDMVLGDEDAIYQLNLFALFLVLQKQSDQAFELEKKLLAHLNAHHPDATVLNHVVCMNIARLHKKNKQFEQSEKAYHQAYDKLANGGLTRFDSMNYAMDKAILCESTCNDDGALIAWITVCLYWLSCPNPYALAVRSRLVLCQERVIDTITPVDKEKVNQFLLDKLKTHSAFYSTSNTSNQKTLDIVSDCSLFGANKTMYFHEGLAFYASDKASDLKQTRSTLPKELELNRLLSHIMVHRFKLDESVQAITTDHVLAMEQPKTLEGALSFAAFMGCHSVYWKGQEFALSDGLPIDSSQTIRIQLSDLLTEIEYISSSTCRLQFTRSYLNQEINDQNAVTLIKQIEEQGNACAFTVKKQSADILFDLLKKQVLVLTDKHRSHVASSKKLTAEHLSDIVMATD